MENIKIKMDEVKAHRETATKMNLHKTGRQFNMTQKYDPLNKGNIDEVGEDFFKKYEHVITDPKK